MSNKVMLLGNLGADPEVRSTKTGVKVTTFRIATSESWTDKASGEKREETEWHTIVVFGASPDKDGLAGVAEKYLRKGSKVYVCGKMKTRKWQAQDGTDRYSTEVVLSGFSAELELVDRKEGNRAPPVEGPDEYGSTSTRPSNRPASQPEMVDDDIPF